MRPRNQGESIESFPGRPPISLDLFSSLQQSHLVRFYASQSLQPPRYIFSILVMFLEFLRWSVTLAWRRSWNVSSTHSLPMDWLTFSSVAKSKFWSPRACCNASSSSLSCPARVVWRSMFSFRVFNPTCILYEINKCFISRRAYQPNGRNSFSTRPTPEYGVLGTCSVLKSFCLVRFPAPLLEFIFICSNPVILFSYVMWCSKVTWLRKRVTDEATNLCSFSICCRTSSSGILWTRYRLSISPLTSIHFLVMIGWGVEKGIKGTSTHVLVMRDL